MPAFSFEKIPAPPRIDAIVPAAAAKPRGRFARLVDRLVVLRLKSTESRHQRPVRAKRRKVKRA